MFRLLNSSKIDRTWRMVMDRGSVSEYADIDGCCGYVNMWLWRYLPHILRNGSYHLMEYSIVLSINSPIWIPRFSMLMAPVPLPYIHSYLRHSHTLIRRNVLIVTDHRGWFNVINQNLACGRTRGRRWLIWKKKYHVQNIRYNQGASINSDRNVSMSCLKKNSSFSGSKFNTFLKASFDMLIPIQCSWIFGQCKHAKT